MVNFNVYDDANKKLDRSKTWVNIKYKQIISREIKFHKYTSLGIRYNPTIDVYNYFIIVSDEKPTNISSSRTFIDDYGRFKIKVDSIWNKTILKTFEKDTNINITHVDGDDTGDVYELDI